MLVLAVKRVARLLIMSTALVTSSLTVWSQLELLWVSLKWLILEVVFPLLWQLVHSHWVAQILLCAFLLYQVYKALALLWWLVTLPVQLCLLIKWLLQQVLRWVCNHPSMTQTPSDAEVLIMGKHLGMTFQEVLHMHPSYCKWVLENCDPNKGRNWSPQMPRLAPA
jgi:hypothetical protein